MAIEAKTMTVPELAVLLGVSVPTVRRALRAGQIPHVKLGARYVVYRARIHEWLMDDGSDQTSPTSVDL